MTQPVDSPVDALLGGLDLQAVAAWLESQRWYASKSRHVTALEVEERAVLAAEPPLLLTMVQARFATGGHDLYQLPLAFLRPGANLTGSVVAHTPEFMAVDALADPELIREVLRHIESETSIDTGDGCLRFAKPENGPPTQLALHAPARPMGVEQSNSSIVFGDETVLKVFRRLEPGINPELELLRFLMRVQFPNIAPLQGWYEYEGRSMQATLGVAQRFFAGAVGGWELALEQIRLDPAAFLIQLGSLGTVTAQLHNALASDLTEPAFAPEEPSTEALALLTATIDENIERTFVRLPDDDRVAAIAGRGQDIRERISMRAQVGVGGRAIRTHGDYHLGQTLYLADRSTWLIIDFEGEPARPLYERRFKASPLRDVAGMLRSFAYATSAVAIMHSHPAPGQFEERARQTFLEHYFGAIDPGLLPAGESAIINLLSIFELEKAIYELQYELDNRPDWLPIPVAGIARLLESA